MTEEFDIKNYDIVDPEADEEQIKSEIKMSIHGLLTGSLLPKENDSVQNGAEQTENVVPDIALRDKRPRGRITRAENEAWLAAHPEWDSSRSYQLKNTITEKGKRMGRPPKPRTLAKTTACKNSEQDEAMRLKYEAEQKAKQERKEARQRKRGEPTDTDILVESLKTAFKRFLDARVYDKALTCLERLYGANKRITEALLWEYRRVLAQEAENLSTKYDYRNLTYRSWLLQARDNFEAFMVVMEWDRAPQARFWLPRRRVLEDTHHMASTIQRFIDDPKMKKLCISFPPGTGKSTLIKFLLAFIAGNFPQSMNMYISYADSMVKMMFDSVYTFMTDPEYHFRDVFPELDLPNKSAEYSTISYRAAGDAPTIGLVSIGGSVTGRTRANKFFITDDLVKNDEEARSIDRLDKLYADYKNTLTTRMIGDDIKEIMLGTIWSNFDPISREKAKFDGKEGYLFIALPVCDSQGHSNFNYDHPDRYTDERIAELKRTLDPQIFSCLYMQQGVEKEGMAFSQDRLQYFNGVLPDGEPDNIYFHADVAWGGGDSFSMPIAYRYGDEVYIPDVIFDKRDKTVTRPRVVAKILHHGIKMGRFEANAGGGEYCDEVTRLLKEHGYTCSLIAMRAKQKGNISKMIRIEQMQSEIRKLYFLAPEYQDGEYRSFMNEFTTFTFTGSNRHDDAVDSLAGLCDYAGISPITKLQLSKRHF